MLHAHAFIVILQLSHAGRSAPLRPTPLHRQGPESAARSSRKGLGEQEKDAPGQ